MVYLFVFPAVVILCASLWMNLSEKLQGKTKRRIEYVFEAITFLVLLACDKYSEEMPKHKLGIFIHQYGWLISLSIFALLIFFLFRSFVYGKEIPLLCKDIPYLLAGLFIIQTLNSIAARVYSGKPHDIMKDGTFIILFVLAIHNGLKKDKPSE